MVKLFSELSKEYQDRMNERWRAYELRKRASLVAKFGEAYAETIWWAKLDYISNWTHDPDYLVVCCGNCGCPLELGDCLVDKPGSFQSRDCLFICANCKSKQWVNC